MFQESHHIFNLILRICIQNPLTVDFTVVTAAVKHNADSTVPDTVPDLVIVDLDVVAPL